jgi:hypothetical protein
MRIHWKTLSVSRLARSLAAASLVGAEAAGAAAAVVCAELALQIAERALRPAARLISEHRPALGRCWKRVDIRIPPNVLVVTSGVTRRCAAEPGFARLVADRVAVYRVVLLAQGD